MRTDDLDTAPNEERDEEKIKEVSQSHPQWESELERVVHKRESSACDSVFIAHAGYGGWPPGCAMECHGSSSPENKMPDVDPGKRPSALRLARRLRLQATSMM